MDTLTLVGLLALAVALVIGALRHFAASQPDRREAAVPAPRESRPQSGYTEPKTRFVEPPSRRPFQLLNSTEQVLYHRLREAMPNMIIFAQVGMAQLAQLRGRKAVDELRAVLGRGVDFIVCRDDFAILAAIELTWPAPEGYDRPDPETAKREALEKLGIPLIVFRPNQLPDPETISREIAEAIVRRNHLESERLRRQGGPLSRSSCF
jgi:hypothetical protein